MSDFEVMFGKPRRGDYRCNFVEESGKHCLFPAEMEKERAHAAYWANRPLPYPIPVIAESPACWSWEVTDEIREHLWLAEEAQASGARAMVWVNHLITAEKLFTNDLCGICGGHVGGGDAVEDHCHRTGLVRGYLCRSCNVREGKNPADDDSVWARYRKRNPYSILGILEPYSGYGWEDGRPVGYGPGEWPPPDAEDPRQNNAMRDVGM